jgi:predicted ATPase/predicted Ser/Thr protein kinase
MGVKCPKCRSENPDDTLYCGKCGGLLISAEGIRVTKTFVTPADRPEKGTTLAGRYRIVAELGRGGMGVVFKAKDTRLDRMVALKFLPPELKKDIDANKRFIQEAKAAAALNHSHICTIYEVDEADDQTFIAMEYIGGQNLKDKLRSGPLDIDDAQNIIVQIAQGLKEAHENGIVHRDIKPANIMLTEKGQVKITDFGLAKLSWGADLTKTSTTMGTAAYMSPEQARGKKVDFRTDIWSLGVVFYEMLTGQLPFKGEHEQAVIYSILNNHPESISKYCEHCPSIITDVIRSALEKQPEKRLSSAVEFIRALQPLDDVDLTIEDKAIDLSQISFEKEKHNLPAQLTSFIGRKQEIKEVKKLLSEHRLVTLIGTGGSGKTRLALRIAEDQATPFKDGVWFINLASANDPELVYETTANVLQIIEEPGKRLKQTLESRLKDKQMLLLLDNCEHLIHACSELAEGLLRCCPGIKILATSREHLKVPSEVAWRVPSLSFPDPEEQADHKELIIRYEAIKLFVERAKTNAPGFLFNEDNSSVISQLCAHLDGIPLAIELAAARIIHLGPKVILDRLDDRFRLLKSGAQSVLPRQKTLQATIDWSHDLLSDKEKILFRRFAVFHGGFNLEAAEDVCAADPLSKNEVLDLLSGLVDKSLATTDPQADGSVRYRLLETIRHYVQDKFLESREEQDIQENHFRYYLALAEKAYAGRIEATLFWLARLEPEHDNLRSALEWSRTRPFEQIALSGALYWFWQAHSHYKTGIDYLIHALTGYREKSPEVARALIGAGVLSFFTWGSPDQTLDWFEESQEMWQELGNQEEAGLVLLEMGQALNVYEKYQKALECTEKCIKIFQELDNERLTIRGKIFLSFCYICQFQPEKAEPLVKPALDRAIKLNMTKEIMDGRHFYADCPMLRGDLKEGEKRYSLALIAALKLGDTLQAAAEMQGMAMCIAGQSRGIKAFRLNGAAEAKWEEVAISIPYLRFWHESLKKYLGQAREKIGDKAAAEADAEGRKMGFENAVKYALDFDKE